MNISIDKSCSARYSVRKANIIYFILFSLTACFLLWRCRYGFADIDEAFYLTITKRLFDGAALFADEWYISLLSNILTYPIYAVYRLLGGQTEGIFLSFRYIFTVFHCLTSLIIYLRLRKTEPYGALAASLCYAIYTPFGIMALSYNSMGVAFVLLTCVLLGTAPDNNKYIFYLLPGILFAAAVLCCPVLIAAYIFCLFSD